MAIDRIWKYILYLKDSQDVAIPLDHGILSVGLDPGGDLCLWAAVDSKSPQRAIEIKIVGTGNPLPRLGDFIGSVTKGSFVWHVFTGPGAAKRELAFHYVTRENGDD